jgi:Fic family protein
MKPSYKYTNKVIKLISSISEKIGEMNANILQKPATHLRKQNRIKTIHSSLKIEGNTLTENQVTAIIEKKRVSGPEKDIREVTNAIKVYDGLSKFNPYSVKSFLNAHRILMSGLDNNAGSFRNVNVGIYQGSVVKHIAPSAKNVAKLIRNLFDYISDKKEQTLIKSCVFHYEIEFIHPFNDGNGRMGRLWQTLILMNEYPVFEYLPFESLISVNQEKYYTVLSQSDRAGDSTFFLEYMLNLIDKSLKQTLNNRSSVIRDVDRIEYFISLQNEEFSRKDYLRVFKNISQATASRDLAKGVIMGYFFKSGDKNKTSYGIKKI